MPSKQRIEYLDLAKGFCILLVVFFHATTYFPIQMPMPHAFKAIRLPLYFFLSGCFFKSYNGFFDFLKRKTNKLLIPFVFWFLLISVAIVYLYSLLGIHVAYSKPVGPLHEIVRLYQKEYFFNIPIWFLLCLFEINILFYLIYLISDKLFKHYKTLAICILSLLFGTTALLLRNNDINLPFFIDSAMDNMPFFAFGYVCFRHTPILKPNSTDKYTPIIITALALFLYFFAPQVESINNHHADIHTFVFRYLSGFAGALFIILLTKWIKYIPIIRWWGRYSIIILILHLFFMKHFVYIVRHYHLFTDHPWTATWVILGITMLCCSTAIPICKRFFPHVTAQKDLLPLRNLFPNKKKAISDNKS